MAAIAIRVGMGQWTRWLPIEGKRIGPCLSVTECRNSATVRKWKGRPIDHRCSRKSAIRDVHPLAPSLSFLSLPSIDSVKIVTPDSVVSASADVANNVSLPRRCLCAVQRQKLPLRPHPGYGAGTIEGRSMPLYNHWIRWLSMHKRYVGPHLSLGPAMWTALHYTVQNCKNRLFRYCLTRC